MIEWLATIYFDRILAFFVGTIALWLSIDVLKESQKTKRLINEGKLRRSTLIEDTDSIENDNDTHKMGFVIDDCYLSKNSSPYMKIGVLQYE